MLASNIAVFQQLNKTIVFLTGRFKVNFYFGSFWKPLFECSFNYRMKFILPEVRRNSKLTAYKISIHICCRHFEKPFD